MFVSGVESRKKTQDTTNNRESHANTTTITTNNRFITNMSWLWGKKKDSTSSPSSTKVNKQEDKIQKTIESNLQTIERLEKRQQLLMKKMEHESERARQFLANGNRTSAKQCLVNKKQLEAQYNTLSGQISNLNATNASLENAVLNVDVIKSTKTTTDAMNQLFKGIGGIDRVEDIMDDSRETMTMADELGRALAQPMGDTIDDDELEDEYAALEESILDQQLQSMRVGQSKLPTLGTEAAAAAVASKKKTPVAVQEDEEFGDLEAELAAL